VIINEFGYLGWMEMCTHCKLVDMTDFSTNAKCPTLPKLYIIVGPLAYVDNLLNLAMKIFKYEVIDELSRLKAFLHHIQ
jgi:hypothetical protein